MFSALIRTPVYDAYWAFAHKRQAAYLQRLFENSQPNCDDDIIARYRFTNAYRAADRVSQYLIKEIQYPDGLALSADDIVFRTLLFKMFNKIATWEALEQKLGRITLKGFDYRAAENILNEVINKGGRVYSAAYIMPSPAFGNQRKHANHLALLKHMMSENLTVQLQYSRSLKEVYLILLSFPGLGPFLSYQFAIDLNYSGVINFDENDFVVAGPGALDGISKCFTNVKTAQASDVIMWMVNRQDDEFARLGFDFPGLFGRPLKAIDCQNLFCEISKYARVAFPETRGVSGRSRIKQKFISGGREPLAKPFLPPKWGVSIPRLAPVAPSSGTQMSMMQELMG